MTREHRFAVRRLLFVTFVVALFGSTAWAEKVSSTVLVLPTQTTGILFERARVQKTFDDRVAAGVQAKATVIPLRDDAPCYDEGCLAQLATKYGVNAVVWANVIVDKKRPPDYHLKLSAFHRDDGQTSVREQTCKTSETETGTCGERQAAEAVEAMANLVEPRLLSATPMHQPEPTHSEPPHYGTSKPIDGGKLQPVSPRESKPRRGTLIGLAVLSGAGMAGGLAIGGVGAAALAVDGKPTCSGPASRCPRVYDTSVMGGTMIGVGVAVLVASTIGLIFDVRALKKQERVTLAPIVGPTTFGLSLGGAL